MFDGVCQGFKILCSLEKKKIQKNHEKYNWGLKMLILLQKYDLKSGSFLELYLRTLHQDLGPSGSKPLQHQIWQIISASAPRQQNFFLCPCVCQSSCINQDFTTSLHVEVNQFYPILENKVKKQKFTNFLHGGSLHCFYRHG